MKVKMKQEASNEARLKSLKHKHEQYNHSKQIIQESLQNLNVAKKQHIFFDDEDDENLPIKKAKIDESAFKLRNGTDVKKSEKKKSSSKKKKKVNKDASLDANVSKKVRKAKSIFSDPLNIENGLENITIAAPTLNKKSNEKLLAMQQQVGNDGRFKIDERFVESDDNKVNDSNSKVKKKSKEVKANLAVFHQVMGPLTVSNVGKQSVHFSDPSTRRYDPSLEENTESLLSNEVEVEEPKEKKQKKNAPKVSKKQFYDVSTTDLKQAFSKTKPSEESSDSSAPKPFSLLSMLGRDEEEEEGSLVNDVSNYRTESFDKLNHVVSTLHSSKIFEYDSSDESEDDADKLEQIISCQIEKTADSEEQERFFLLSKTDSKFDIAKQLSNRHKLNKDWDEIRKNIIDECKSWHRNASMWNKTQKKKSDA